MSRRLRFPVLPALVGAALLAVGCSESLDPGRRAVSGPRFATAAADPIALDQVNGTFGEGLACAPCNPSVLRKGFNPTNPHNGDAIIATFFWISTPPGGNIITEVNDSLADGFTRVGNTYTLVDFVTAGNVAMATYVATDVQNIPQGTFPTGENVLLVSARLSVPVADGGMLISAWTGVAPDLAAALGETRHASGSGTGVTVADPGAITVNAGALAYGVSLVNGLFGLDTPPSPWTTLMTQGDLLMKGDGEYDAEFTVADAGGTVDPRWAWHFSDLVPGTWLASVLALNPPAPLPPPPPSPGDLTVTTTTTGASLDPDGYTVTVDDATSQPIATNGSVTFTGLSPGDHSVALSGVAGNCTVTSANPVMVTVFSGETATADFAVDCAATAGTGTPGKMTGGGKLGDKRDFTTFGFEASAAGGKLTWVQHCVNGINPSSATCSFGGFTFKGRVDAGSYSPVDGSSTCRTWSGTGSADFKDAPSRSGTYTFTVNAACDNGEPGRGRDYIDISIGDYQDAGNLTGGNIQLHKDGH